MLRALTVLVRLFPLPFRQCFASGMVEQIVTDYARARTQGLVPAMRFAVATAFDLLCAAVAEHCVPTVPRRATEATEREMLSNLMGDLRHAVRGLRRAPGFTMVAVGTLGLAIGATAGIFTVVNTVLLHPLPYGHMDRLTYIAGTAPGSDMPPEFGLSDEFLVQYRERSKLIEDVATFNSFTSTLRTPDRVERVRMSMPSHNLFSTLGARPILGRLPLPEDDSRVAVISYQLWQSWFGGDSSVIGKSFQMAGSPRTVIGIMGADFRFPTDGTLLWISDVISGDSLRTGNFGTQMVARIKPGVTNEALASELTGLARQLPERFGGSPSYVRTIGQLRIVTRSLRDQILGNIAGPLWILLASVGLVLLIACANVANLFLVRAEGRQRDMAVRRAIGAGRPELIRMQMAEAAVIAVLAGALAMGLTLVGLPVLLRSAPPEIPRIGQVHLGPATLLFTLATAIVAALACGLVPAVRASGTDLNRLRDGSRGSTSGRSWGRDGLVVAQTALALVLLIGSGLLLRSFDKLRHVDPGYDTRDIFTFQIAPDRPELNDGPSYARFNLNFMDRLRALPGVTSVGLIENVPLNEGTSGNLVVSDESGAEATTQLQVTFEAGNHFKTMGIKVLEGRPFTDDESLAWHGTTVVSKSAAQRLWPGKEALGRRLRFDGDTNWMTVVGVVNDVMQSDFRTAPEATVYLPIVGPTPSSWRSSSPAYVIKTARAEVIAPEVRAIVREIAPEAPMYRIYTMAGLARDSMLQLSFTMLTLGIASMLALILGAVGLYGVLSYVVAQRTREIGVRMALGAEAGQVRRMVVVQGVKVVGIGVVIGVVAAIATTRALDTLLFGVQSFDLLTFLGMSALLLGVGVLASYLPARRASNVDPLESLRGE